MAGRSGGMEQTLRGGTEKELLGAHSSCLPRKTSSSSPRWKGMLGEATPCTPGSKRGREQRGGAGGGTVPPLPPSLAPAPLGRGRLEQGVSDGAVRAQRWYLEQRPCRYCSEGCWQIALSRSIPMKDEIGASCESSPPRGPGGPCCSSFPLALGGSQKLTPVQMGLFYLHFCTSHLQSIALQAGFPFGMSFPPTTAVPR